MAIEMIRHLLVGHRKWSLKEGVGVKEKSFVQCVHEWERITLTQRFQKNDDHVSG